MNKIARTLMVVLLAMLVLTGCNPGSDAVGEGTVRVIIQKAAARGINSTDFETSSYEIIISNTDKNLTYSETYSAVETEFLLPAATGNSVVTVRALNNKQQVIGEGKSAPFKVRVAVTTACPITVIEREGEGNLVFDVNTKVDFKNLSVRIFEPSRDPSKDEPLVVVPLTKVENLFSASKAIAKGYYQFVLVEDDVVVTSPETVRVVAGYDAICKLVIDDNGKLSITITNKVTPTPDIALNNVQSFYVAGGTYDISAVVKGMANPSFRWYIDDVLFEGANGARFTGTIPMTGVHEGKHEITCVAFENNVIWSAKAHCDVYGKDSRPVELKVPAGEIELTLTGNVLLPGTLSIEYQIDGVWAGSSNVPCCLERISTKGGKLTAIIRGADGYSYYFEPQRVDGTTVVNVVIDKPIVNAGYIHVTYNQDFPKLESSSVSVGVRSQDTVFPAEHPSLAHRAYIPVNYGVKERTFKVESDTYIPSMQTGCNSPAAFDLVYSTEPLVVESGKTVELVIGNEPYAEIIATLPGVEDGIKFDIFDAYGHYIDQTRSGSLGSKAKFYSELYKGMKLYAIADRHSVFSYYECEPQSFVVGSNEVTFVEKQPAFITTDIAVKRDETIKVVFDIRAAINEKLILRMGVDTMDEIRILEEDYLYIKEDGNLRILTLFNDNEYVVEASFRPELEDGIRVMDVVIDLAENNRVPVTLNYDFKFDAQKHFNMYPIIRGDSSIKDNIPYFLIFTQNCTRKTINLPVGKYSSVGSSAVRNRNQDWNEILYIKDNTFEAVAGVPLDITVGVKPR